MKSSGNKKVPYYWAIYNDGSLIPLECPKKGFSPRQVCAHYAKVRGVPWRDLEPHLSAENLGDNWKMACSRFRKLPLNKQKPIASKGSEEVCTQMEIDLGPEIYDY